MMNHTTTDFPTSSFPVNKLDQPYRNPPNVSTSSDNPEKNNNFYEFNNDPSAAKTNLSVEPNNNSEKGQLPMSTWLPFLSVIPILAVLLFIVKHLKENRSSRRGQLSFSNIHANQAQTASRQTTAQNLSVANNAPTTVCGGGSSRAGNVPPNYEDAVNKQSAGQVNSLMDPGALGLTQAQIEQIDVASCKSS